VEPLASGRVVTRRELTPAQGSNHMPPCLLSYCNSVVAYKEGSRPAGRSKGRDGHPRTPRNTWPRHPPPGPLPKPPRPVERRRPSSRASARRRTIRALSAAAATGATRAARMGTGRAGGRKGVGEGPVRARAAPAEDRLPVRPRPPAPPPQRGLPAAPVQAAPHEQVTPGCRRLC
jgi:hypothetical protein